MAVFSAALVAGIASTHVVDPLAHGREGTSHCISSDAFVGLTMALVLEPEDQEVADLSVFSRDLTEGFGDTEGTSEFTPDAVLLVLGLASFASGSVGGDFERSAESILEFSSGGRWSKRQGCCCGYRCSK